MDGLETKFRIQDISCYVKNTYGFINTSRIDLFMHWFSNILGYFENEIISKFCQVEVQGVPSMIV